MEDDNNSDLDFSFTSTTSAATDRTFTSSSARTSLSLTFNHSRRHRRRRSDHSDPHWSAIAAAAAISPNGNLNLTHLKLLKHLGTGNLGRVFLCRIRDYDYDYDHDHVNFALKVVDREFLSSKKLSNVKTEGEILSMLDHPFLPTLYAHIEISHYTCLLIDYCPNGDLHALLRKQPGNRFPIDAVRFYAAEVLVAIEYLHSLGIVYRDLKPENILIRQDGHIMLSDFDLCFRSDVYPKLETNNCRRRRSRRRSCFSNHDENESVTKFVAEPTTAYSRSCVGTHEYLAPELVSGNGHGSGVDWWAYGIFIYELLNGTTPFKGGSKEGTLRNIASTRGVRFFSTGKNGGEENAVRDLIERLLVKDPRRRLGCNGGASDIKSHPFFNGVKWALIRMYKPPDVRGMTVAKRGSGATKTTVKRRRWLWKGFSFITRKMRKGTTPKYNVMNSSNKYYKSVCG